MNIEFIINSIAFINYLLLCFHVTSDNFYKTFVNYLERHRGL